MQINLDNRYMRTFGNILQAKAMNTRVPRLPQGQGQVLLRAYRPRPSHAPENRGQEITIIDTFHVVVSGQGVSPNELREWPYMPDSHGWRGVKEQERLKQLVNSIKDSVADLPPPTAFTNPQGGPIFFEIDPNTGNATQTPLQQHNEVSIAALATAGYFNGIQLAYSVDPAIDNRTQQYVVDRKGRQVFNIAFTPVPGQQLAAIQARGKTIESIAIPALPQPGQQQGGGGYGPRPQYQQQQRPQFAPQPNQQYAQPQYQQAPQQQFAPTQATQQYQGQAPVAPQYAQPQPQYQQAPVAPAMVPTGAPVMQQYAPQQMPTGPVAGQGPLANALQQSQFRQNNGGGNIPY